jgi:SPP1 gp7 family putative phage head morphogenesis protein
LPKEYLDGLDKVFKETLNQLYNSEQGTKNKEQGQKLLAHAGKTLAGKVLESYKGVAVDYEAADVEKLTALQRNVWQFSAAKNYHQMRDLTDLLVDKKENRQREFSEFKTEAEKLGYKYNQTWMRTEYDSSVSAAQNAARWVDYEQEADIIPNLQYETVGDEFVRESHRVLDGIIRPISDSFWNTHYPPNGWNCRCEALQVPNGLGKITPDRAIPPSPVPQMFRTNLAKTGLIFPKNHPYFVGIEPKEIRKSIAYLPPENTYFTVRNSPQVEVNVMHGTHEVMNNYKTMDTFVKYADANNRALKKVEFLPEINEKDDKIKKRFLPKDFTLRNPRKNPDAVFHFKNGDTWVIDYKYMTGNGSHLYGNIVDAYQKADYAIVQFSNENITVNVRKEVDRIMRKYNDMKGVFVFDKEDGLIYSSER